MNLVFTIKYYLKKKYKEWHCYAHGGHDWMNIGMDEFLCTKCGKFIPSKF